MAVIWGLDTDLLVKAWDAAAHPRHPAGASQSKGGEFAPKQGAALGGGSVLADADPDLGADGKPKSRRAAARVYLKQGLTDAEIILKMKTQFPEITSKVAAAILYVEKAKLGGAVFGKKPTPPAANGNPKPVTPVVTEAKPTDALYEQKMVNATHSAKLGLDAGHSQKDVVAYVSNKYGVTMADAKNIVKDLKNGKAGTASKPPQPAPPKPVDPPPPLAPTHYDLTQVNQFAAQQIFAGNSNAETLAAVNAKFPNIDAPPALDAVIAQAQAWQNKGIVVDGLADKLQAHFPANAAIDAQAAVEIVSASATYQNSKAATHVMASTAQKYLDAGLTMDKVGVVLDKLYPLNDKDDQALAVTSLNVVSTSDNPPTMAALVSAVTGLMEYHPQATYERVKANIRKLFPKAAAGQIDHAVLSAKISNSEPVKIDGAEAETVESGDGLEEPLTIVIGKPKSRREAARFYLQQALPEKLIVKKMQAHFPDITEKSALFILKIERDKIIGKQYVSKKTKLALKGPLAVEPEIEALISKFDPLPEWTGTVDQAALRQWRDAQAQKYMTPKERDTMYDFVSGWSGSPMNDLPRFAEHLAGEKWGGKSMSGSSMWGETDFAKLKQTYPQYTAIMSNVLNMQYALTQKALRKVYPDGMVRLFRGVGNKTGYLKSRTVQPKQYIYTDALSSWSLSKGIAKGFGEISTGRLLAMDVPIRDVLATTWESKMYSDDKEKEFILIGRGLEREADIYDMPGIDLALVKAYKPMRWSMKSDELQTVIPNIDADPEDKAWLALLRRYPERYPIDTSLDDIPEAWIPPQKDKLTVPPAPWGASLEALLKRYAAPRVRPPEYKVWR